MLGGYFLIPNFCPTVLNLNKVTQIKVTHFQAVATLAHWLKVLCLLI